MILVLDIGTSSLKVALIDDGGAFKYQGSQKYSLIYHEPNIVEMNLNLFNSALNSALEGVGEFIREYHLNVRAISVTSQRSSVIAVDEKGRALSEAITWQDKRAIKICERLKGEYEAIREVSGMNPSPVYSAPKMALLKEINRSVYDSAYKLVGFCEYTLFKLSGVWASDTSIASRTGLFDIRELQYSPYLLDLYEIDKEKLAPVVEVGACVGESLQEVNQLLGLRGPIPVYSAGGDQQCAALGNGCMAEGDIAANFGTGAYLFGLSESPVTSGDNSLICNVSALEGMWILESYFNNCGLAIEWINDLYFSKGSYSAFEEASRSSPLGSNGLLFFPAKGLTIYNLEEGSSHDDIARALLEGIVFTFAHHYGQLQNGGERVVIGGGVTRDPFFNQMISSVLNRKVVVSGNSEATLCGAWISTATRLGLFNSVSEAYTEMAKNYKYREYLPHALEHEAYKVIEKNWCNVVNNMEDK